MDCGLQLGRREITPLKSKLPPVAPRWETDVDYRHRALPETMPRDRNLNWANVYLVYSTANGSILHRLWPDVANTPRNELYGIPVYLRLLAYHTDIGAYFASR